MATEVETRAVLQQPEYVYFHHDGAWGHKREVLHGEKTKATFTKIPVIDIGRLYSNDIVARKSVAREIVHACENVGFFYIKNHGIDEHLINATLESNRRFFAKPEEVKMKQHIYKSKNVRGYEPVHGARLDITKPLGGEQIICVHTNEKS